eukprot:TRINITY_DN1698_c2_g1_i1.p1 TRINITY_DN1698_c2_g1~~TRINITY_DN1698_c2_g1_i1.p1  ORF type:complete len:398 (+),score=100.96 TRINITY_DN1698_c2_g1_i1:2-1195(+)
MQVAAGDGVRVGSRASDAPAAGDADADAPAAGDADADAPAAEAEDADEVLSDGQETIRQVVWDIIRDLYKIRSGQDPRPACISMDAAGQIHLVPQDLVKHLREEVKEKKQLQCPTAEEFERCADRLAAACGRSVESLKVDVNPADAAAEVTRLAEEAEQQLGRSFLAEGQPWISVVGEETSVDPQGLSEFLTQEAEGLGECPLREALEAICTMLTSDNLQQRLSAAVRDYAGPLPAAEFNKMKFAEVLPRRRCRVDPLGFATHLQEQAADCRTQGSHEQAWKLLKLAAALSLDHGLRFELACVCAVTGREEDAVRHLRRLSRTRFSFRAVMESNDLGGLYERDDFQKLVQSVADEPFKLHMEQLAGLGLSTRGGDELLKKHNGDLHELVNAMLGRGR